MKRVRKLICGVILSCFLLPFAAAKDLQEKTISLPGFTGITLDTVGDLYISRGAAHSFTIEAEPKVVAVISAKVKNNNLFISSSGDFNTDKPINLKVVLPELSKLELRSSGDVQFSSWKSKKLEIFVSGSGTVKADKLQADKVVVKVDGSGDVELDGAAQDLLADISGTGSIEAGNLKADYARAKLSGSGDMKLNVKNKLDAEITGSGDIEYVGNPKLSSKVHGSGEISRSE